MFQGLLSLITFISSSFPINLNLICSSKFQMSRICRKSRFTFSTYSVASKSFSKNLLSISACYVILRREWRMWFRWFTKSSNSFGTSDFSFVTPRRPFDLNWNLGPFFLLKLRGHNHQHKHLHGRPSFSDCAMLFLARKAFNGSMKSIFTSCKVFRETSILTSRCAPTSFVWKRFCIDLHVTFVRAEESHGHLKLSEMFDKHWIIFGAARSKTLAGSVVKNTLQIFWLGNPLEPVPILNKSLYNLHFVTFSFNRSIGSRGVRRGEVRRYMLLEV